MAPRIKAALTVGRAKTNRDIVPISEDERDSLLRAAGAGKNRWKAARDQALIWLLWDSGFRIGEAVALNVESVRFDDQQGAHLILPADADGLKTGPRTIYVVESVPALKVWVAFHKRQLEPDAPLFYGKGPTIRMGQTVAGKVLDRHSTTAQLSRNVWPHLFRHTRATRAARGDPIRGIAGWNDAQMRAYFGWEASSHMPAWYSHLAHRDMEERVRADANADPLAAMIRADPLTALAKLAGMTAAATLEEYRRAEAIDMAARPRESRHVSSAFLRGVREAAPGESSA